MNIALGGDRRTTDTPSTKRTLGIIRTRKPCRLSLAQTSFAGTNLQTKPCARSMANNTLARRDLLAPVAGEALCVSPRQPLTLPQPITREAVRSVEVIHNRKTDCLITSPSRSASLLQLSRCVNFPALPLLEASSGTGVSERLGGGSLRMQNRMKVAAMPQARCFRRVQYGAQALGAVFLIRRMRNRAVAGLNL